MIRKLVNYVKKLKIAFRLFFAFFAGVEVNLEHDDPFLAGVESGACVKAGVSALGVKSLFLLRQSVLDPSQVL